MNERHSANTPPSGQTGSAERISVAGESILGLTIGGDKPASEAGMETPAKEFVITTDHTPSDPCEAEPLIRLSVKATPGRSDDFP